MHEWLNNIDLWFVTSKLWMWIKIFFIGSFFICAIAYLLMGLFSVTPWGKVINDNVDNEEKRMKEDG